MTTKSDFQFLLRRDLSAFIECCFRELNACEYFPSWHLEVVADVLEKCRRGEIHRLIVNLPPRNLKSIAVTISFVAWLLGHDPATQVICVSYVQDLSDKFARDCRTVMQTAWYQELFATRIASDKHGVSDFCTTAGGNRLATSTGGQLTGLGADYIIIDDPQKAEDALSATSRKGVNDWFDSTVVTRLNDKRKGCIILVMQRLHLDDLTRHLLEHSGWTLLRLPAIAEQDETHACVTPYGPRVFRRQAGEPLHAEREPLKVLEEIRKQKGQLHYAAQYQQAPVPVGGNLVKTKWFPRYRPQDLPSAFDDVIQSWDTANKPSEMSDYSVGITFGVKGNRIYVLHVLRDRFSYPQLREAALALARQYRPRCILIEDRASGSALIQDLRDGDKVYAVKAYQPLMDKIMRMDCVSGLIENGQVYLPEEAPWVDCLLRELEAFPQAKFDDQADALSQGLDHCRQQWNKPVPHLLQYLRQIQGEDSTA